MSEFKGVSAVEWLIEQINEDLIHKSMGQVYEQAKVMEKQQKRDAYLEGISSVLNTQKPK
jgi:hypothetical protein